jgi:hypothetical protein
MPRLALRIHVSEPWTFERENESADLTGWTADHREPDKEDWIVNVNRPYVIDEERFEQMRVSPRYLGESFHNLVENSLVSLSVNIVPCGRSWADMDGRPLAMVGLISRDLQPETRTEP